MGILFSLLDALGAANIKECVADIKSFRKEYPKVIPKSFTNERAARLLGLLNTNQIELEELGGTNNEPYSNFSQLLFFSHPINRLGTFCYCCYCTTRLQSHLLVYHDGKQTSINSDTRDCSWRQNFN